MTMNRSGFKKSTGLCLMLVTSFFLNACFQQKKEISGYNDEVRVLELNGTGYQRGLQHGKALKTEIGQVYKKWKHYIELETRQNADTVIEAFHKAVNFEPAIRKWTPEIYEEVKGIAEGSGQSLKDVYCFQLPDELWVYMDQVRQRSADHCSGIGIAATQFHPAYIAQNMDLESFRNGYQILLHISKYKNEPEQYILSCAGLIALNGLNSESIGVTLNTLMQLTASADGLPVAYIIRGVLSKNNEKEATSFLETVRHASGQNYILGAQDTVYNFEASANKVVRFLPTANNPNVVYHTNHPVSNDDVKPWHKDGVERILSGKALSDNSLIRFQALKKRMDISSDPGFSDQTIKEILRSKDDPENPVCRTYDKDKDGFTFSSVIFTLGNKPSVQLTNGSPDQSEYSVHKFTGSK